MELQCCWLSHYSGLPNSIFSIKITNESKIIADRCYFLPRQPSDPLDPNTPPNSVVSEFREQLREVERWI